jgi:hypothetical protein
MIDAMAIATEAITVDIVEGFWCAQLPRKYPPKLPSNPIVDDSHPGWSVSLSPTDTLGSKVGKLAPSSNNPPYPPCCGVQH